MCRRGGRRPSDRRGSLGGEDADLVALARPLERDDPDVAVRADGHRSDRRPLDRLFSPLAAVLGGDRAEPSRAPDHEVPVGERRLRDGHDRGVPVEVTPSPPGTLAQPDSARRTRLPAPANSCLRRYMRFAVRRALINASRWLKPAFGTRDAPAVRPPLS